MRDCLECREGCGACCIAPSITSPLPGMPLGKPAGVPCAQLGPDMRCQVFGTDARPGFCGSLRPAADLCGGSREEAFALIQALEQATRP